VAAPANLGGDATYASFAFELGLSVAAEHAVCLEHRFLLEADGPNLVSGMRKTLGVG
jgi:hypothetical protein